MNKDYKVFVYTDKYLKRKYTEEILEKYYYVLAFLFQNGFELNCEKEEIEEQLSSWNFFENEEDLYSLISSSDYTSNFEVGTEIISEELYSITKSKSFTKNASDSPIVMKAYAEANWEEIQKIVDNVDELFNSKELEIFGAFEKIKAKSNIIKKINEVRKAIDKEMKVLTWVKFNDLINCCYSIYLGFNKKSARKVLIASNFNDEIYGGIGGYNPNTKEVKCIIGSAVYDIKTCYNSKTFTKVKSLAKNIFQENPNNDNDDEYIRYLESWYKGIEDNDEKAKRIVINCCLWGVFDLLMLKHGINFIEETKSEKYEDVMDEFRSIMNYCGINKDYLL